MSHVSLTAKYRPQTFGQVAGQETVKAILSRASLEQRVAPAYLFSGTRGVGKTTLARIFAKALNCRTAPAAEPCNQCDQCRAITHGSAVDVVEIDGASNRGIDDVRRLKEVVGYAAMEGGYKIFIIDEAHMLSREAFNALLKTLEEPPARVTFIMATTEPHKFPATIISRCQHYVFKPLSEGGLVAHLTGVLEAEQVDFDQAAVRLIARRGAGSVRDSMSLLGQVLALGDGRLTEESARSVLGLAGQESFIALLQAFRNGDAIETSRLLHTLLDQGLDLGFFLRELAALWRNLFMLSQSGEAALAVVDLPDNEARRYLELSREFSLAHIHACWQMTLEGQRRVLTSLEPAQALELLLLNLGMLPKLLSLEKLSAANRRGMAQGGSGSGSNSGNAGQGSGQSTVRGSGQGLGQDSGSVSGPRALQPAEQLPPPWEPDSRGEPEESAVCAVAGASALADAQATLKADETVATPGITQAEKAPTVREPQAAAEEPDAPAMAAAPEIAPAIADEPLLDDGAPFSDGSGLATSMPDMPDSAGSPIFPDIQSEPDASDMMDIADTPEQAFGPAHSGGPFAAPAPVPAQESVSTQEPVPPQAPVAAQEPALTPALRTPAWESIFTLCLDNKTPPWLVSLLRRMDGHWLGDILSITAHDSFVIERMQDSVIREQVEELLGVWCGRLPEYDISARQVERKSRSDLKAEVLEHPLVREVQQSFGGYVIDFGQIR